MDGWLIHTSPCRRHVYRVWSQSWDPSSELDAVFFIQRHVKLVHWGEDANGGRAALQRALSPSSQKVALLAGSLPNGTATLRHTDQSHAESAQSFMSIYWLPVLLAILIAILLVACQLQMSRRHQLSEQEDPFLLEHQEQDGGRRSRRSVTSKAPQVRQEEQWADGATPRSRSSRTSIRTFRQKFMSESSVGTPRSVQADRLQTRAAAAAPRLVGRSHGEPHQEFCFAVPIDALAAIGQHGVLEVRNVGDERQPVRATLNKVHGSQSLTVFVGRKARAPITTVGLALQDARTDTQTSAFEVRGADGSHYGLLELQSDGSYNLMANGHPLLTIDGSEESTLSLRLFSGNRVQIGQVSCRATGGTGAEEVVEIRSLPAIDPMLVVTCVLAVLLMCGEEDRGHPHAQQS